MQSPDAIQVLILCSRSKKLFNPLGEIIEKEQKLGFSHYSIAIIYDGQIVISEVKWPRPRFVSITDWLKTNDPIFVFKKEVKNQFLMFKMMSWMSIVCTTAFYSLSQLFLIYAGLKIPAAKKWFESVKLNHDRGLICSEYIINFLHKFFGFEIEKSEDSVGLREPFDALTASWILLDQIQTAAVIEAYSKSKV